MSAPPVSIAPSSTARLADKGTSSTRRLDPAVERRTVDALVTLSCAAGKPLRRKAAREVVLAYSSKHGPELDGWAHWLHNEYGFSDPTGESVRRRIDGQREGGHHAAT